jgi:hypothetical protein
MQPHRNKRLIICLILACLGIGLAAGIVLVTQKSVFHTDVPDTSVTVAVRPPCTAVSWGWEGGKYNKFQYVDSTPWIVPNVTTIASGAYHDIALKEDGSVVGWGDYNSLGTQNLSHVIAIAAGAGHNLALKDDGTVVAWGTNFAGQCDIPKGLTNVVAISAGQLQSTVLTTTPETLIVGETA